MVGEEGVSEGSVGVMNARMTHGREGGVNRTQSDASCCALHRKCLESPSHGWKIGRCCLLQMSPGMERRFHFHKPWEALREYLTGHWLEPTPSPILLLTPRLGELACLRLQPEWQGAWVGVSGLTPSLSSKTSVPQLHEVYFSTQLLYFMF